MHAEIRTGEQRRSPIRQQLWPIDPDSVGRRRRYTTAEPNRSARPVLSRQPFPYHHPEPMISYRDPIARQLLKRGIEQSPVPGALPPTLRMTPSDDVVERHLIDHLPPGPMLHRKCDKGPEQYRERHRHWAPDPLHRVCTAIHLDQPCRTPVDHIVFVEPEQQLPVFRDRIFRRREQMRLLHSGPLKPRQTPTVADRIEARSGNRAAGRHSGIVGRRFRTSRCAPGAGDRLTATPPILDGLPGQPDPFGTTHTQPPPIYTIAQMLSGSLVQIFNPKSPRDIRNGPILSSRPDFDFLGKLKGKFYAQPADLTNFARSHVTQHSIARLLRLARPTGRHRTLHRSTSALRRIQQRTHLHRQRLDLGASLLMTARIEYRTTSCGALRIYLALSHHSTQDWHRILAEREAEIFR